MSDVSIERRRNLYPSRVLARGLDRTRDECRVWTDGAERDHPDRRGAVRSVASVDDRRSERIRVRGRNRAGARNAAKACPMRRQSPHVARELSPTARSEDGTRNPTVSQPRRASRAGPRRGRIPFDPSKTTLVALGDGGQSDPGNLVVPNPGAAGSTATRATASSPVAPSCLAPVSGPMATPSCLTPVFRPLGRPVALRLELDEHHVDVAPL